MLSYTSSGVKTYAEQARDDLRLLNDKIKGRLEWSDTALLRAILVFLDTQSWDCSYRSSESDDLTEMKAAVELLVSKFREPLEAKGAVLAEIQDELEEVVEYARRYLSLDRNGYHNTWYKLHTTSDSRKWTNVLLLYELIFSLPFSNSHIERMFSSFKLIKTNRRTSLSNSTMKDLLELHIEGPEPSNFVADKSVELWWKDCSTMRRVNQQPRQPYRTSQTDDNSSDEEQMPLEDWDRWFGASSPVRPEVSDLGDDFDEPL